MNEVMISSKTMEEAIRQGAIHSGQMISNSRVEDLIRIYRTRACETGKRYGDDGWQTAKETADLLSELIALRSDFQGGKAVSRC
jgi:hypothetical protein